MTNVEFRLLGSMEIWLDGQPAKLPGPAERSVLAQLLLSPGRTIPATMLVDRLWAESSLPADPINALQVRISKLRRSLAVIGIPDAVAREGAGYRIHVSPQAVDAVEFARLLTHARESTTPHGQVSERDLARYDDALDLWRGEPLADFRHELWAEVEANRLTELRLAAITERSQIALAVGRQLEVISDLEPLVVQDPTLESLAGLLMVALYRTGRQADALDVFARTRRVLDDELGLAPSLSLRSLHERVLRQDPGLGAQSDVSVPVMGAVPRRPPAKEVDAATLLPLHNRPLIGRDDELNSLVTLIQGVRLLTLIGPGGAGKTSLALATMARVASTFDDGAFVARLGAITSPAQVPLAVAEGLQMPLDGAADADDVRQRLMHYLAHREVLLLIDNCEHVVDAAAGLIDQLVMRCPRATVIATSREALAIPDEIQVTVGPLATPPEGTPTGGVLDYPACQLFVERARAVRPGVVFDGENLEAIARIARELDGMPLAVELAAARVATMSPLEISDRLVNRFTFLTSGTRTAEARQQTLRATVDWSYALLSDMERRVFNRLSIFQGGWTLTAAEAVVVDDETPGEQVVEVVARLAERSMIVVERGANTRYRMLETLRQYAAERLNDSGEKVVMATRHADYYRRFAEGCERALRGSGQRETMRILRQEQPNVRSALAWFSSRRESVDSALYMAGSLGLFWHLGRHLEGREVLARLLTGRGGSPRARAHALQALSLVERPRACLVHPSPRCADAARESLEILERLDDGPRAALSRVLLAVEGVTGAEGERCEELLLEAERQFEQDADAWGMAVIGFVRMETALKAGDEASALPIGRSTAAAFRHLDDPWGLSAVTYHLGWGLRQFGRYEEALRVLEEAIDVADRAGLHNTVQWAMADLGITRCHVGDIAGARDLFTHAAAASHHVGDGAGAVLADYGHGLLAHVTGEWTEARERYASAVIGFRDLGTPVMQGSALAGLARCDEEDDAYVLAETGYQRALEIGRSAGEPALSASALEGLARVAASTGRGNDAQALYLEAARLRRSAARPAPPHERRDAEALGLTG